MPALLFEYRTNVYGVVGILRERSSLEVDDVRDLYPMLV